MQMFHLVESSVMNNIHCSRAEGILILCENPQHDWSVGEVGLHALHHSNMCCYAAAISQILGNHPAGLQGNDDSQRQKYMYLFTLTICNIIVAKDVS